MNAAEGVMRTDDLAGWLGRYGALFWRFQRWGYRFDKLGMPGQVGSALTRRGGISVRDGSAEYEVFVEGEHFGLARANDDDAGMPLSFSRVDDAERYLAVRIGDRLRRHAGFAPRGPEWSELGLNEGVEAFPNGDRVLLVRKADPGAHCTVPIGDRDWFSRAMMVDVEELDDLLTEGIPNMRVMRPFWAFDPIDPS
ncbi:hypothetical protein [Rhodococcus sp. NPDC058514]|uniref:hypothetical protein n=1 Tax=unclassified Rhodococcus (in: high G+C Gram-positive bacteria) TaxID=192944 RepID=UPI00364FD294